MQYSDDNPYFAWSILFKANLLDAGPKTLFKRPESQQNFGVMFIVNRQKTTNLLYNKKFDRLGAQNCFFN